MNRAPAWTARRRDWWAAFARARQNPILSPCRPRSKNREAACWLTKEEAMSGKNPVDRRSFLSRVVGASVVATGAMALITGPARAQKARSGTHTGRSDSDSTDRAGYGHTGVSDSDSTDGAGFGRTGLTDHDSTDQAQYGRGTSSTAATAPHTGRSDSDSTDRAGYGHTGVSDGDSTDGAGFGRTGLTDHDSSDQAQYGRGTKG